MILPPLLNFSFLYIQDYNKTTMTTRLQDYKTTRLQDYKTTRLLLLLLLVY
jgi:hypothetical protein